MVITVSVLTGREDLAAYVTAVIVVAVCTFRESIAADITLVIIRRCVNTACESIVTDVALVIVIAVYTYAHNRVTHYTFMLFFLTDSQCLAARITFVITV